MKVSKHEVLSVLARVGRGDVIEKAKRDLRPDVTRAWPTDSCAYAAAR